MCALLALTASACNGDDAGPAPHPSDGGCAMPVEASLDCETSFDPDFMAIYDNVIEARCGTSDTGCHGTDAPSGLVMAEPGATYEQLLGEESGHPYVIPGSPECSELVLRVQSSDRRVRMPLNGEPLDARAICAIRHWIADGAAGP